MIFPFKKIALTAALLLLILSALVACTPAEAPEESTSGSVSGSVSGVSQATALIDELIAADTSSEKTELPVIIETKTVRDGRAIYSGSCEKQSEIYVVREGKVLDILNAAGGMFMYDAVFSRDDSPLSLSFYAKAKDKGFSEPADTRRAFKCSSECPFESFVLVGQDGWLFFTNTQGQYTNNVSLTADEKNAVVASTKEKVKWLSENTDAELIYLLIPNTNDIYSEYMPADIAKGSVSLRQEVGAALSEGGACVIDLYDVLLEHKDDALTLYHKTDSHWTEYGAYFGYEALFNEIAKRFPNAAPRDIGEFNFANEQRTAGDLYFDTGLDHTALLISSAFSKIGFSTPVDIDKYMSLTESRINEATMEEMVFTNNSGSRLPRLYIMRDSYSVMMFDWIAERSSYSYFRPLWRFDFNTTGIKEQSPDYIIYIITEMNIISAIQ